MNGFATRLGAVAVDLIPHLWNSTLFMALILAALSLGRSRLTASARFALAFLGIVRFAIPAGVVASVVQNVAGPYIGGEHPALAVPFRIIGGVFPISSNPPTSSVWPIAAASIWLAGALVLLAHSTIARHRLVALSVRTAVPPLEREVAALARAREAVGVRQSIDLARAPLPEAPAVLRVVRPLVVLPIDGCEDLSDDELECLLRHECAHVKRNDNLTARAESIISSIFWFHPLIWIAQRIAMAERERACDEMVASSADERVTYLAALRKFCRARIAPRLPGVSCMATAQLKERMDHVMKYDSIQRRSPSSGHVAIVASVALALFVIISGFGGTAGLIAGATSTEQFAVRLTAERAGEIVTLYPIVIDNKNGEVLSMPKLSVPVGQTANAETTTPDLKISFDARAIDAENASVKVTITRGDTVLQESTLAAAIASGGSKKTTYTGQPIELVLKDANIREVLQFFGKLTKKKVEIDDGIEGKVTVSWHNVPWDQAFDSLISENGLRYEAKEDSIHVMKR